MAVNRFSCPGCQTTLKITTPELVGKKIRCPKCKTITVVPGGGSPPQPKPEPKRAPAPAAIHAPPVDDDEIAAMMSESGWEEAPHAPAEKQHAFDPAVVGESDWKELPEREPSVVASAGEAEEAFDEELPPRKRKPIEDEDEEPRPPARPASKKRGKLVPILVGVVCLGYVGALGATLMGTFDPKPVPTMNRDEAMKLLFPNAKGNANPMPKNRSNPVPGK